MNLDTVPIRQGHVVYSGTHCGDWVAVSDAQQLLTEARRFQDMTSDPVIRQFMNAVIELAEASIATGNPIVF